MRAMQVQDSPRQPACPATCNDPEVAYHHHHVCYFCGSSDVKYATDYAGWPCAIPDDEFVCDPCVNAGAG